MFKKIGKIILLLTFSFDAVANQTDSNPSAFYAWVAQSQVMSSASLSINQGAIRSDYATLERIANSTPMLKFYADELSKQNVPLDFVILPLIESGNNPQARSPMNALGLWQFMPMTGREWGLGVREGDDERIDVQKSTAAAAAYLRSLHNQFHDWNLVLASYNWGPASVGKALHNGLLSNDGRINMNLLPRETRNYFVSFYAFNQLIRDNHKKKLLAQYPNRPFLIKIQSNNLAAYIKSVPSLTAVNLAVLRHMNGFDLSVVDKPSKVMLVPTDIFAQYFMTNKISFKIDVASHKWLSCRGGERADYIVRYGDTIETIARKYKMSVNRLIELNPSVRFSRPGITLSLC